MLSNDFQFHTPTELSGALALLDEHGDGGKVLAGGMSMVPAVNLGLLRPSTIISLNHVSGLDSIREDGDVIRIGSMVRHERLVEDPLIARHVPALAAAARLVADEQVRHRGTIGGSIAHADPAADYLPVVVAFDATLKLASTKGERTVKARDFFVDVMMTALEPSEILVEIAIPKLPPGGGSSYVRLHRVEGSFAIVNAAAVVNGGSCVLAIGGAVPTPVLVDVTADLSGDVSEATYEAIAESAFAACQDASGDLNGSADYRRSMSRVFARRAVEEALKARAGASAPNRDQEGADE
jgi:CO/xanthine dehydrogenase FAD-binding subunit